MQVYLAKPPNMGWWNKIMLYGRGIGLRICGTLRRLRSFGDAWWSQRPQWMREWVMNYHRAVLGRFTHPCFEGREHRQSRNETSNEGRRFSDRKRLNRSLLAWLNKFMRVLHSHHPYGIIHCIKDTATMKASFRGAYFVSWTRGNGSIAPILVSCLGVRNQLLRDLIRQLI